MAEFDANKVLEGLRKLYPDVPEQELNIPEIRPSIELETVSRPKRKKGSIPKRKSSPTEILRYPYEAITDFTDYLELRIVNYERGSLLGQDRRFDPGNAVSIKPNSTLQVKRPLKQNGVIFLPIPSNVQDGNSVDFSDSSLDGLTASIATTVVNSFDATGSDISNMGQIAANAAKELTGTILSGESLNFFNRMIAAEAANIPFGGNLTPNQLLARQSGQILNPNMELLFNGVKLRSFKFSFKMTPRDQKEARTIRSIIHTLKRNMAPSGVGNLTLQTPNIFELTYRRGLAPHPYLNKFKQCALTDLAVNYTGENVYATYDDGSPVSYVVDLGFKELEPIYQEDYYEESDTVTESTPQGY